VHPDRKGGASMPTVEGVLPRSIGAATKVHEVVELRAEL
jgi:hypothetical protein